MAISPKYLLNCVASHLEVIRKVDCLSALYNAKRFLFDRRKVVLNLIFPFELFQSIPPQFGTFANSRTLVFLTFIWYSHYETGFRLYFSAFLF